MKNVNTWIRSIIKKRRCNYDRRISLGVDFRTSCLTHHKDCEIHKPRKPYHSKDGRQVSSKRRRICATQVPVLLHKLNEGLHLYHRITDHVHGCSSKKMLNNNACYICHQDISWVCNLEILPAFDKWRKVIGPKLARERTSYGRGEDTPPVKPRIGDGLVRYGLRNKHGEARHMDVIWGEKACIVPTLSVTAATVNTLHAKDVWTKV